MGNNHLFRVLSAGMALCLLLGRGPKAFADDTAANPDTGIKIAQFDADDAYDPFADYSEFDEAQEEEADINFFRHGRFLTLGLLGGMRGFTEGSGQLFQPAPSFGLFLSYFFDMRFALQFSFTTSSHAASVTSAQSGLTSSGTVGIQTFSADLKYYMNTQNVSKGLGKINPYLIGGFSSVDRTVTLDQLDGFAKEGALGVDLGVGFEIPFFRNKMYFGGQAMYQLVNFPDKNSQIVFQGNDQTGKYANGDTYTILGVLGINF